MAAKKIFAVLFVIMTTFTALFSTDWYLCMGSFENKVEAENKIKKLEENGIFSQLVEYKKMDGTKFYRIYFNEKFDSEKMAEFHKQFFMADSEKSNLIGEAWITQITQTTYSAYKAKHINAEKRVLIIKDSDTGNPVVGALLCIDEKWNLTTSEGGKASLPEEMGDGEHNLTITKGNEYVPTKSSFTVSDGVISSAPQISIPKAVDYSRIKIVLDWGEYPLDLDSHIFCGSRHVYYSNKSSGNLNLDRDDTDSYGPETITIQNPSPSEVYNYYIFNYSDKDEYSSSALSNSNAQINVIVDNEYRATYKITPNQTGLWWHVFDVVNGYDIVTYDKVSNEF